MREVVGLIKLGVTTSDQAAGSHTATCNTCCAAVWRKIEHKQLVFSSRAFHNNAPGTPSLCEVRAEGWSELSPRCVGAAARRAGLSPLFCDAPISRRPVCFLMHTLPPFGPAELGGFFLEFLRTDSEFGASRPLRERIRGHRGLSFLRYFSQDLEPSFRRPGQKLFCFWVWLVVRSRDRATPPTM